MVKVLEKRRLFPNLWVMQCKECGNIVASASNEEELPEFAMCDCNERKGGDD